MTFKEALYWLYHPDNNPVKHGTATQYAIRLIKKYGPQFDAEQAIEDFNQDLINAALGDIALALRNEENRAGHPVYLFGIDKRKFCNDHLLDQSLFMQVVYRICQEFGYVWQKTVDIRNLMNLSLDPNMHYFTKRGWKCVRNPLIELDIDSIELQREFMWIKEESK